jgi:RNA polymerase sigma factor (sigma-70 family)
MDGMMEDEELLREYVEGNSERAFSALVERHIDMVHFTAVRMLGDLDRARDVTQTVFILLARNASAIRNRRSLAGWLYRTARHTAARFRRAESCRQQRETSAFDSWMNDQNSTNIWEALAPHLDDAMGALGEKDQDALALRFFQQKSLREVGEALGLSEDASQKRITRALEKLRAYFSRRGIAASLPLLTAVLHANAVQGAPIGLSSTIAASSFAAAPAAAHAGSFIWNFMATTKAKLAIAAVIAATAVTTSIVLNDRNARSARSSLDTASAKDGQLLPKLATAADAPAPKSLDEIVAELHRLSALSNMSLRHAGVLTLAESVASRDIAAAIMRAERLSDARIKTPFIHLLLARLAESDPPAAIVSAKSLSSRDRVIEAVRTVLDTWTAKDLNAMTAWMKTIPRQERWDNSILRSEAMLALARVDPKAALALIDGEQVSTRMLKTDWYPSIFEAWAAKDLTGALAVAQELPPGELKNHTLASVIGRWTATDPGGAAAYSQSLPHGPLRQALVNQIARGWSHTDPKDAAEWINSLTDPGERYRAGSYLIDGFASRDPKAAAEFAQKNFLDSPDYIRPWSIIAGEWAKTDVAGAVEWMKQLPSEKLMNVVFGSLVGDWAQRDPAAAAAYALKLPEPDPTARMGFNGMSEKQSALETIIKEWTVRDPQATLHWIQKLPSSEQGPQLKTALESWALMNPQDAAKFVVSNFAPGELQTSSAAQVAAVWGLNDPSTAAEWVIAFPEGPMRDQAMSGLVASWATNDVQGATTWLKLQPSEKLPTETIASFAAASRSAPSAAAEWIERMPRGPQKDALLNLIASNWMAVDRTSCRAWVQESSMPEDMKRNWLAINK